MTGQRPSGRRCGSCGERYAASVLFCPTDGTPTGPEHQALETDPHIGRIIQGEFRVERLLGIGAMARVYLAQQLELERPVALKILHRALAADEAARARLRREAMLGAQLRHPNLTEVLMLGSLEPSADGSNGELFLVMEYLDGFSLSAALLASGGRLPLARAAHIVLQLCAALGEAHAAGVVHRDLKPENVMLVRRGADADFAKLLDFGMARAGRDPDFVTRDGAVLGTARYIAPEGAQGGSVGPEADVYALTTLLYQCLAGRTPFEGPSAISILVQQVSAPPPDVRSFATSRDVPSPLAELIARNLDKDPKRRAPHASALGAELSALLTAGLQVGTRSTGGAA
jgi:serine/threonine-protein kinase